MMIRKMLALGSLVMAAVLLLPTAPAQARSVPLYYFGVAHNATVSVVMAGTPTAAKTCWERHATTVGVRLCLRLAYHNSAFSLLGKPSQYTDFTGFVGASCFYLRDGRTFPCGGITETVGLYPNSYTETARCGWRGTYPPCSYRGLSYSTTYHWQSDKPWPWSSNVAHSQTMLLRALNVTINIGGVWGKWASINQGRAYEGVYHY